MDVCVEAGRGSDRQIRLANPEKRVRASLRGEVNDSALPRKVSSYNIGARTVHRHW